MSSELEHTTYQIMTLRREDATFKAVLVFSNADFPSLLAAKQHFLHAEELDAFFMLKYSKKQRDYLLGKYVAKKAISYYASTNALNQIRITPGVFQFPVLYGIQDKIQISLSHDQHMAAAIAFSEMHPMGIDLEAVDQEKISVIATQLTSDEKQLMKAQNYPVSVADFLPFVFWTSKEALSKVLRTGMMTPFEIYAVGSTEYTENYWISEFINFPQYKSLSFLVGQRMVSIVLPKRTWMQIDVEHYDMFFKRE